MTSNDNDILSFDALIQDIQSSGKNTASFSKRIRGTQRRILDELVHNGDFYLNYAHLVAPPAMQNSKSLHELVQDGFLRAIRNNDAIDESQDLHYWLMSEILACIEETELSHDNNPDDLPHQDNMSLMELLHISRIHQALLAEKPNLTEEEGIILSGFLVDMFSPDDIPESLLQKIGMERDEIQEIFNDIFEKLRGSKKLRDLYDDLDPDEPIHP